MISVCIPTYNGERFISDQLNSILSQLNENDEVIISDDGSTDKTIDIIKALNDKRIVLSEKNNFKSPVYNMENALKMAKGDYIFLSDQDDIWVENKVKLICAKLKDNILVISNASIVDENLNIIEASYFDWKKSGKGFWKNFHKNTYIGCAIAFRKELLNYILPFPKNLAMHDIWIGLMAELTDNVLFLDENLILYRRHENNLTYDINRTDERLSDNSLIYKLSYRFLILFHLIKRKYFNF